MCVASSTSGQKASEEERVKRLKSRIFRQCGFAITDAQAEAELEHRRRFLVEAARRAAHGAKEEPSFLE